MKIFNLTETGFCFELFLENCSGDTRLDMDCALQGGLALISKNKDIIFNVHPVFRLVLLNGEGNSHGWSGIRPLVVDPRAKSTESISRDHVVCGDLPSLVTITGGKWTTYRSMAEDMMQLTQLLNLEKLSPASKCMTYNLHLIGADGWEPASLGKMKNQHTLEFFTSHLRK